MGLNDGRGKDRCLELMLNEIGRLRSVGYAVFIIAHTKKKDQNDVFSGESYEQITNNLSSTFYNPIANTCQMIVNIVMDREIEKDNNIKKKENPGAFNKEHNKLLNETRMMYFVGTSTVDAGGRFNGLPEKLPLSAESFMSAFETGVKNSMINTDVTVEQLTAKREEEVKEIKKTAEKIQKAEKAKKNVGAEIEKKKEMMELFQLKAKELSGDKLSKIKDINAAYSITAQTFKDIENFPMEALTEYIDVINME